MMPQIDVHADVSECALPKGILGQRKEQFSDGVGDSFPHPSAAATVPYFASVACSSPAALAWDPAFQNNADPSGRAVSVHQSAL